MKANVLLKKVLMELSANRKMKFAQDTLDNGTILEAEAFEAGNEVFIVTDEERIPMPVGDYTLADGRALIVEEEGMIASVGEAAEVEAEEDVVEEDVKIEAEDEEIAVEVPEEVAPAIQEIVEAVVEVIAPIVEEMKKEMEEIKEEMANYKKMSKQSSAKTIKHNPTVKESKVKVLMSEGRGQSTLDRVLARLNG
jgi:hypothetical protein